MVSHRMHGLVIYFFLLHFGYYIHCVKGRRNIANSIRTTATNIIIRPNDDPVVNVPVCEGYSVGMNQYINKPMINNMAAITNKVTEYAVGILF